VRVIAGRLGGRTLVAPAGTETRPTSDRVREALFSILGDLQGSEVLDVYAGTGALGIEALSRGANSVTFVECARKALRALRQNLRQLDLEPRARVIAVRVERLFPMLPFSPETFDLVFIDPPYIAVRSGLVGRDLASRPDGGLAVSVQVGGRVVLEHASSDAAPELQGLKLERSRTYGDSALSFYVR
jgi:16S rRNA (guanine966-N2)-methyltransferase